MNLILVTADDFLEPEIIRLEGRRHSHVSTIHRASPGDKLRLGTVGGNLGVGKVLSMTASAVDIQVVFDQAPPPPLPLTLFLALPRPKAVPRVLQMATNLGVKRIFLLNAVRVEKVYWSCRQLDLAEMRTACLLGLEQARDTVLPEIHLKRLFKPFVEDELPAIIDNTEALLAHPSALTTCPYDIKKTVSLAVGPEGGFIDYEISMLEAAGFRTVRTLDRILKVETAISSLIGRLM